MVHCVSCGCQIPVSNVRPLCVGCQTTHILSLTRDRRESWVKVHYCYWCGARTYPRKGCFRLLAYKVEKEASVIFTQIG